MVWIWQALYERHLRWYEENRKIEKRGTKSQARIQNRFWTPFGNPKWNHFEARIICHSDFGGTQVGKKGDPKRGPKKASTPPRDHLRTQPREGGGRVNPSQQLSSRAVGSILNLNHLSPEGWWEQFHGSGPPLWAPAELGLLWRSIWP